MVEPDDEEVAVQDMHDDQNRDADAQNDGQYLLAS